MKRKFLALVLLLLFIPQVALGASLKGVRSPQDLYLDGEKTSAKGYAFNGYNYYRLRDLGQLLKGRVDFNADGRANEVTIYKGTPYVTSENDKGAQSPTALGQGRKVRVQVIEGKKTETKSLTAYNIGGFNYFKLRDMGQMLGFDVGYDGANNRAIVRTYPSIKIPEENMVQGNRVVLGNERLFTEYSYLINGKNLGLITNQTGVDGQGTPLASKLKAYPGAKLVALYSPEHGLDGKQPAGEYVESYFDSSLNLPVYSLYGKTRKPSMEMLQGVDVLLFDMQDIGSRTYTYISTLNYAMRAAREAGIPIVVLDRPNPLGGNIVEGYIREKPFFSFVGIDQMPMAHGMTVGELGLFFNREIKADLKIVPLKNWTRDMVWQDTGLVFGQTSPNIPDLSSAFLYMATGSGEGTGIGQDEKFHWVGGKDINSKEYARRLNAAGLPGVKFIPVDKGSRGGVRLEVTDYSSFNPARTGIYTLAIANQIRPINIPELQKPYHMFYLIQGSTRIADMFRRGQSPESIVADYQRDVQEFKNIRQAYLLY